MVVVFDFTPAPPWIPYSTRLSFEVIIDKRQTQKQLHVLEKHCNEMSNLKSGSVSDKYICCYHLGVGGRETSDQVWSETAVCHLSRHLWTED